MKPALLALAVLFVAMQAAGAPLTGGDTIETATAIDALPYIDTGSTFLANDDYDEGCLWGGIGSPDVVYALKLAAGAYVTVDLCGSTYDTRVYVYDHTRVLMGCSDDTDSSDPLCNPTDSRIDALFLEAAIPYYIVVDGFGGDSGGYVLKVSVADIPVLVCPEGARLEGEPPLVDGVGDTYNCGCSCANPPARFQKLGTDAAGSTYACLRSGWNAPAGAPVFDEDWLTVVVGPDGLLHFELVAERATELIVRRATCEAAVYLGYVTATANEPATLDVHLAPGTPVWAILSPSPFFDPGVVLPLEYSLHLTIDGQATATPNGDASWGEIKAAYR